MSDLIKAAVQKGVASFMETSGRVPPSLQLLKEHAPGAFAGYGLMRDFVMCRPDQGGALDMKTKELIFALLDTLAGQKQGAINHAKLAMKNGLTTPELAEGLVQVMMVGGISTWNGVGADVLAACAEDHQG
jgi:alkylhydroperoxidase/carboxymuconolactone decarboxylase family protein YurZ